MQRAGESNARTSCVLIICLVRPRRGRKRGTANGPSTDALSRMLEHSEA